MPIFEFSCSRCGSDFEKLIISSGGGRVVCPDCGSKRVRKRMSLFGTKSGDKFVGSRGGSCSGCVPATPSACRTCR